MNFWSLNNILEFPDLNLNPENQLLRQPDVSVTSVVNWTGLGQTWQWVPHVRVIILIKT